MAELGSSARPARFCSTNCHVPGVTCMTPRALAPETIELLNPLSCQATAAASEGETPLAAATCWICEALNRVGWGAGAAALEAELEAGAGAAVDEVPDADGVAGTSPARCRAA